MKRFLGHVGGRHAGQLWSLPAAHRHHGRELLFRGFIANRAELLNQLALKEQAGSPVDDAALFAAAHQRWGAALNSHVLGEYALALYVPETRTLLLTRDGLGIQPLFYCASKHGLSFASHLEELFRLVAPGELDECYLGEHLLFAPHAFGRTPFRNIAKLVPGCSMLWTDGVLKEIPSWRLGQSRAETGGSDAEQEQRFRELLFEAVTNTAPSGRKTWSELSGGQDSSSIVCAAAHAGITGLETVSFVYSRCTEADESVYSDAVVAHAGFPSHRIDEDTVPPFSLPPARFFGEPNLVLPQAAFYRRYEALAAEHGVEVMLSGNGGDHVLIGDGLFPLDLADHLKALRLGALWCGLKAWQRNSLNRRSLRYLFGHYALMPALRHWQGKSVSPRFELPTPEWLDAGFLRRFAQMRQDAQRTLPDHGDTPSRQYFIERVWDFSALLNINSHQAVQGFEFRYPLMYRPLVEFLYAVPWQKKLTSTADRDLQRRALRDLLPVAVRERSDKAVLTRPVLEGFARSSSWPELLSKDSQLVARGLAGSQVWIDTVARARLGQVEGVAHFVAAATLESWLKSLKDCPAVEFET